MKKKSVLYAFISTVILLMISGKMALLLRDYVPSAIEVNLTDGTDIVVSKQVFGLATQIKGNMENNLNIQLLVTNSRYGEILPLQWKEGGYFLNEKEYYAVIPDTFITDKETFSLGDKVYTICGVYKTNPWESNSVIYISPGEEEVFAEKALIVGETEPAQQLLHNASKSSGILISGDVFDLRSVRMLALQFSYLGFFFGMCVMLAKVFLYGGSILTDLYDWKENSSISCLKQFLKAVLIIGIAALLLGFLLNGIHIPSEYLPIDNLFDWTHYWKLVIDFYEKRKVLSYLNTCVDAIALFMPLIVGNSTMVIIGFVILVKNCNFTLNKV